MKYSSSCLQVRYSFLFSLDSSYKNMLKLANLQHIRNVNNNLSRDSPLILTLSKYSRQWSPNICSRIQYAASSVQKVSGRNISKHPSSASGPGFFSTIPISSWWEAIVAFTWNCKPFSESFIPSSTNSWSPKALGHGPVQLPLTTQSSLGFTKSRIQCLTNTKNADTELEAGSNIAGFLFAHLDKTHVRTTMHAFHNRAPP